MVFEFRTRDVENVPFRGERTQGVPIAQIGFGIAQWYSPGPYNKNIVNPESKIGYVRVKAQVAALCTTDGGRNFTAKMEPGLSPVPSGAARGLFPQYDMAKGTNPK